MLFHMGIKKKKNVCGSQNFLKIEFSFFTESEIRFRSLFAPLNKAIQNKRKKKKEKSPTEFEQQVCLISHTA